MKANILDREEVSLILVDAIADQRVAEVARGLSSLNNLDPSAKALVDAAVSACEAISNYMLIVQSRILAQLLSRGVSAEPVGEWEAGMALQYHSATLRISRSDLRTSLRVLEEMGFEPPIEMTASRVKALSMYSTRIKLLRFDDFTTRIVLEFYENSSTFLPKILRPGIVDLAEANLPFPLFWGYSGMKLIRLLKERFQGRRSPHHEIDFLGTPVGLIEPILRTLSLGPESVLVDLGCGDGRIVRVAAEVFGCRAVGVEHNPSLAARAKLEAAKSTHSDLIEIRQESAEEADLSEATVVFMFLPLNVLPAVLGAARLCTIPGTRLVMHEQTRPGSRFIEDLAIPVFSQTGITVVRIQTSGQSE